MYMQTGMKNTNDTDLHPYVFAIDKSRSKMCFKLRLLKRGVQVTTYDFGFMDNPTTNQLDRSLYRGYFTSDNEPDGTKNATHTTFPKKAGY
jgi:hypothetical protein